MTNSKHDICKRVKQARGKIGFTQQEIADALEISRITYKHYEDNVRMPDHTALKFCEITGTRLMWLKYGDGPAYQDEESLTDEEKKIAWAYRDAPDHKKRTILDILGLT